MQMVVDLFLRRLALFVGLVGLAFVMLRALNPRVQP
jgi:hypothetical protein